MDKGKIGFGKLYVVIGVESYIPQVLKVTPSRDEAVNIGVQYADEWKNDRIGTSGEIYFNQESEGDMADAVSVTEVEVEGIIVLEKAVKE